LPNHVKYCVSVLYPPMSKYQYTPGPRMGEPEFPNMIIQHYLSLSRQNCFVHCFLTLSSLPQDQNLVVFIKLNRPISWSGPLRSSGEGFVGLQPISFRDTFFTAQHQHRNFLGQYRVGNWFRDVNRLFSYTLNKRRSCQYRTEPC
jgi:hypothetical protein